ncbi:MAG: nucleoside-diphosphate sugar epimerase/dehydratase [Planctomycetaceae bacterium]
MKYRLAAILPTYLVMFVGCYYAAFLLRFDFTLPPEVKTMFFTTVVSLVGVKFMMCLLTGEWQRSYRYATFPDVFYVAASATGAAAIIFIANYFKLFGPIPRSVILIDWALTIPASGLVRIGTRVYTEIIRSRFARRAKLRTLVMGIDREAIEILRTIQASDSEYQIVGLVDEKSSKNRSLIAGVPIFPLEMGWAKLTAKLSAEHVLIPSSVSGRSVREIVEESKATGFKAHVIPSVQEIVGGRFKLSVRDVTISDLLRREPAQLDMASIREYVENKRVLVTGAAGSIGSELCRQLLRFKPSTLVMVDQSEFGMFTIGQEFETLVPPGTSVKYHIADVADPDAINRIMESHKPEAVFHAAAYKHVPLMEDNVREAIRNNVLGTKNVVDRAEEHQVQRFVLISTDKAVRPTSVMGATKLMAEKYVQAASTRSDIRCITVRFGNVLNSAGSVVPTFRRQIENGGPVTVTHPEMERFFMTIPEAVQLVLQAGAIGGSGDVLVLEMGEPCKIVDLAKDMISLSGLKYPDDIEIVFTGLRPGEKLYEELFYDSESCSEKIHDKIFCATRKTPALAQVINDINELRNVIGEESDRKCSQRFWEVINRYVAAEEEAATTVPFRKAA